MKRKSIGRLLSGILACTLACMLAFTMTALAATTAEQSKGDEKSAVATGDFKSATITASTGYNGDVLNLYKAVDVSFANNDVTYTFTDAFGKFVTAYDAAHPGFSITNVDDYMKALKEGTTTRQGNADFEALLGAFSAYARVTTNNVPVAYTSETKSSGSATFTGVAQGQYVIVGTGNVSGEGTFVYETMTASVVPFVDSNNTWQTNTVFKLTMKTNKPTVEKTVTTTSDAGYSVGDKVSYQISADVPVYSAGTTNNTFFIGDKMKGGLKLDPNSIKVYKNDASEANLLKNGSTTYYTIANTSDTTFQVNLSYADVVNAGATKIIVTYDATITAGAVTGKDAITNKATLTYTTDPFSGSTTTTATTGQGTSTSEVKVSTYGLEIKKQDKDTQVALAKATFALYTDQACTIPVNKDAEGNAITITTNDSGYASYSGLKKGTYYLKETVAPTGYKLLQDPVTITVSDSNTVSSTIYKTVTSYTTDASKAINKDQAKDASGKLLWLEQGATSGAPTASDTQPEGMDPAYVSDVTNTSSATVTDGTAAAGFTFTAVDNTKGTSLPTTGGMGTTVFYVLGGCIVAGAAIALVQRKRATTK